MTTCGILTQANTDQGFIANDDPGVIPVKSRLTAFVLDKGKLSVECWEVDDLLPDISKSSTKDKNNFEAQAAAQVQLFSYDPGFDIFFSGSQISPAVNNIRTSADDTEVKPS